MTNLEALILPREPDQARNTEHDETLEAENNRAHGPVYVYQALLAVRAFGTVLRTW